MRLIDADKLKDTLLEHNYTTEHNQIFCYINEQPTAYDIDKVVEELEELKMKYFLNIANTGNEMNDFAYEQVGNALDKAIEIVKQGGTAND